MKRRCIAPVCLLAAAAAGGCSASRHSERVADSAVEVRAVRGISADSAALTAVVRLARPRLTLRPAAAGAGGAPRPPVAVLEADSAELLVHAGYAATAAVEASDSLHRDTEARHTAAVARADSPWRALAAAAAGLIALLAAWKGIRSRL